MGHFHCLGSFLLFSSFGALISANERGEAAREHFTIIDGFNFPLGDSGVRFLAWFLCVLSVALLFCIICRKKVGFWLLFGHYFLLPTGVVGILFALIYGDLVLGRKKKDQSLRT